MSAPRIEDITAGQFTTGDRVQIAPHGASWWDVTEVQCSDDTVVAWLQSVVVPDVVERWTFPVDEPARRVRPLTVAELHRMAANGAGR